MHIKLKVCGMKEVENITQLNLVKPDFMGMIFYAKSPRYVPEDLKIDLVEDIALVGVFVNSTVDEILEKATNYHFEYVQLHGEESVELVKVLKSKGMKVIKAFSIGHTFPEREIQPYDEVVDYFLFDTKSDLYGGSGKQFDWDLLSHYPFKSPYFLSGGIELSDVPLILKKNLPQLFAIDVNSRFEIKPGLKDIEKVKALKALL